MCLCACVRVCMCVSVFVCPGMCQPRVVGSVGAEPFSAKLRYTGANDVDHPNLIKLTVNMPHIDGETPQPISDPPLTHLWPTSAPPLTHLWPISGPSLAHL